MNAHTEIPPAILPHAGRTPAGLMQRISAAADARTIARALWSWGGNAPTRSGTLEAAILYHGHQFRCASRDRIEAVVAFIAAYVPGGRDVAAASHEREAYREFMTPCMAAADAELARLRREYREARK